MSDGDIALCEICRSKRDDLKKILAIENVCFPARWIEHFILGEIDEPASRLWVAKSQPDDIVGYMAALKIFDELHILQLAVRPDMRRKGIAKAMLEHALRTEPGIAYVYLEVREHNETAQAFYKSLSFLIDGVRERYYSDTGEDAILMSKAIK